MANWKTLDRKPVLERGKWLRVEDHAVELPDGALIPDWPWVVTPDYVCILPETPEGDYFCFRQEKYAVEGLTLSVPGGYIEPGEESLPAAQRELREEMGLEAAEWVFLGKFVVDGNRGAGHGYLYLARQARFVGHAESDDLEALEPVRFSRAELQAALQAGEFKVLGWAMTVALALLQ